MGSLRDLSIIVALSAVNYVGIVSCEYMGSSLSSAIVEEIKGQDVAYKNAQNVLEHAPLIPFPHRVVFFAGIEAHAYNYVQKHKK